MIQKRILIIVFFLVGCSSTLIKPEQLQTPKKITCIFLLEPISYNEKVTKLFASADWVYRFERGPYVSEKVDMEGTYFRGPPGAISISRPEMKDKPSGVLTHMIRDGGFFVPHDPTKAPKMYNYFSVSDAAVTVPDVNTTCSGFAYYKEPDTSKLSVISFAAGGAVGGVLGRAMVPNSQLSYGQSAAAGAIAMAIMAAFINADVGKIITWESKDNSFLSKLKSLPSNVSELKFIDNPPK